MIVEYLDFLTAEFLPEFFILLDSLTIADGVSWLGLTVGVSLLCIYIGSILMRVS